MGYTVLVTGATGKTGRRLVPLLAERGVTVRAGSRAPAPARPGVEPVRFDWDDARTHPPALEGADAVYVVTAHLTGDVIDLSPGVAEFVARAAAAGVRRLVLLSSFGAESLEPDDPLRRRELIIENSGLPSTILRPGAFMQNFSENHWSGLVDSIRERGEVAMPGGEQAVSYVATQDIAAVAAAALTEDGHEGKGYTLTGPAALTLAEVAAHISAATGRDVRYVDPGPDAIRRSLVAAGAAPRFAEYVSALYLTSTSAMATVTHDITAVTGRPATTFAEYAKDAADAWRP